MPVGTDYSPLASLPGMTQLRGRQLLSQPPLAPDMQRRRSMSQPLPRSLVADEGDCSPPSTRTRVVALILLLPVLAITPLALMGVANHPPPVRAAVTVLIAAWVTLGASYVAHILADSAYYRRWGTLHAAAWLVGVTGPLTLLMYAFPIFEGRADDSAARRLAMYVLAFAAVDAVARDLYGADANAQGVPPAGALAGRRRGPFPGPDRRRCALLRAVLCRPPSFHRDQSGSEGKMRAAAMPSLTPDSSQRPSGNAGHAMAAVFHASIRDLMHERPPAAAGPGTGRLQRLACRVESVLYQYENYLLGHVTRIGAPRMTSARQRWAAATAAAQRLDPLSPLPGPAGTTLLLQLICFPIVAGVAIVTLLELLGLVRRRVRANRAACAGPPPCKSVPCPPLTAPLTAPASYRRMRSSRPA